MSRFTFILLLACFKALDFPAGVQGTENSKDDRITLKVRYKNSLFSYGGRNQDADLRCSWRVSQLGFITVNFDFQHGNHRYDKIDARAAELSWVSLLSVGPLSSSSSNATFTVTNLGGENRGTYRCTVVWKAEGWEPTDRLVADVKLKVKDTTVTEQDKSWPFSEEMIESNESILDFTYALGLMVIAALSITALGFMSCNLYNRRHEKPEKPSPPRQVRIEETPISSAIQNE